MFRRLSIVGAAIALLMLIVVPATAAKKGTDRPFKADLVGEVEFAFFTDCGSPAPPKVSTESWGNATHMGRVKATWEHCAGGLDGSGITNGHLTMEAANGDQIVLTYTDTELPNSFPMEIRSGTGRFADAAGTLVVTFGVEPQFQPPDCDPDTDPFGCLNFFVPWPWWASIEGAISY
ncbi:MAG: hypothetical protein OES13_11295 [Acidimicrobiia bacterium]|nr:hypothetical protein [Acidimicrobiia bacterium]